MSHVHDHHDHASTQSEAIRCYVLTVSDTRDTTTDTAGLAIRELLSEAGHFVMDTAIVRDDPDEIRNTVIDVLAMDIQAVIVTGGTGVSTRDNTINTLKPMIELELDGFGELFRAMSFEQIGARAMLSRSVAGITRERKVMFCLPGSEKAVRLAIEKLILPVLGHLIWELNR